VHYDVSLSLLSLLLCAFLYCHHVHNVTVPVAVFSVTLLLVLVDQKLLLSCCNVPSIGVKFMHIWVTELIVMRSLVLIHEQSTEMCIVVRLQMHVSHYKEGVASGEGLAKCIIDG
jgi:hypothetical protein